MNAHVDFVGVLFVVWGLLTALVLCSVDLVLLPFGTALGIYALWTLLTEQGKNCFAESLNSEV